MLRSRPRQALHHAGGGSRSVSKIEPRVFAGGDAPAPADQPDSDDFDGVGWPVTSEANCHRTGPPAVPIQALLDLPPRLLLARGVSVERGLLRAGAHVDGPVGAAAPGRVRHGTVSILPDP